MRFILSAVTRENKNCLSLRVVCLRVNVFESGQTGALMHLHFQQVDFDILSCRRYKALSI